MRHGSYVYVYVTVSPPQSGQYVNLSRYYSSRWHYMTRAKITKQRMPNGKTAVSYVVKIKVSAKATYTYRTERPAWASNAAGSSRTLKVKGT